MSTEQVKDAEIEPTNTQTTDEEELSEDELEHVSGGSQNQNWANHHTGGDGTGSHYGE